MSACGSGKSSKGGGSKSRSKGGKGDALHKKVSLQTSKEHLTTLRQALRDELGHDRDVVSGFGAFTKYDRNDLALDIHFRTGSTITDDELEWAYELVSSNLGPLGHKWKAQALMDDLCDPSSRYALVTERTASAAAAEKKPASKSKGKKKAPAPPLGKPVAFAHFRFTVQGETREAMEGEPVLMLRDLHVEADYQRKGLGRHLCQLLELSARKNSMRAMMLLVPSGSRAGVPGRAFVDRKLKGFACVDDEFAPVDVNLSAYSKSLVAQVGPAKKPETAPAASPDSILAGPERVEKTNVEPEASVAKLETAFESATIAPVAEKEPEPAAPALFAGFAPVAAADATKAPLSFASFGTAAAEEISDEDDENEEDGEWEEVDDDADASGEAEDEEADDILAQLVELFKAENGREPTEEEVHQWMQTLKEAAEQGGLAL